MLNQRYVIKSHLASGGMADVYLAHDLMLDRKIAIKILRDELSSSSSFRERFHQEAKSAANLSHPSIVTIHDFGLDHGKLFLVMEYIPGSDLKSIMQIRGRYTVEEALPLFIQACSGLGYAHHRGVIHCDIKPHNLIVTPDAHLKITDFGIARALSTIDPDEKASVVWGSPQYFSPEQAAGDPPSPASDVYSLGVVIYEVLTGRLPFIASSAAELSTLHRTAIPAPPREFNSQIPEDLENIILKVLSKEPSARYRSADQLGRILMSVQKSAQPAVQKATSTSRQLPDRRNSTSRGQSVSPITQPTYPLSTYQARRSSSSLVDIDWITWGLVLLALIAVGGLIPLWLWVYLLHFPLKP